MKKAIIIFILSFLYLNVKGQVWIDEGAVWHYELTTIGHSGIIKYEYTKDTLIDGQNCQVITGTQYSIGFTQQGISYLISESNISPQYTYASGDTVFYWNHNEEKFFVLYNFGAEVGDTWIIANEPPSNGWSIDPETDNEYSEIEVIATGTIEINSEEYRYIEVKPTYGSLLGFEGIYVERFGNAEETISEYHRLFPNTYDYTHGASGLAIEWYRTRLNCYQDNSFPKYSPIDLEDCEYLLTTLGMESLDLDELKYYPTPSTDIFTIENPYPETLFVDIYDAQGSLVDKTEINSLDKAEIDLSNYKNGLYFAKTKTNTSQIKTIKIVKL